MRLSSWTNPRRDDREQLQWAPKIYPAPKVYPIKVFSHKKDNLNDFFSIFLLASTIGYNKIKYPEKFRHFFS